MRKPHADSEIVSSTDSEMDAEQERLFHEWRDLHLKAQRTLLPIDAHASGQAYRRFHESYLRNTEQPSTKVIPFPLRPIPDHDLGGAA